MGSSKLHGKRIYLSLWKASDAKRLAELCNDKSIHNFTGVPYPYTIKHARDFIKKSEKKLKAHSGFSFAIILKEINKPIGCVDLIEISKRHRRGEIGYWLGSRYRQKGYMGEALQIMLKFCFNKLKLNRVEITCAKENFASKRTIESSGARFEGLLRRRNFSGNKFHDVMMYGLLKSEYKQRDAISL